MGTPVIKKRPAQRGLEAFGITRKVTRTAPEVEIEDLDLELAELTTDEYFVTHGQDVQTRLLAWYDKVHRVLPWRATPASKRGAAAEEGCAPSGLSEQDFAYRVWVSEVMLQQTQVATVIKYHNAWTSKWPTVADLARATQEDVNAVWAGLGYYRRAQYLLKGAQHVVNNLDGKLPPTAKELASIPGIGAYTAGAIASIAFGECTPAVDGNVVRVMSRLRTLGGPPTGKPFMDQVAAITTGLLRQPFHADRPGDFNQALMEMGATCCKPASPTCGQCPLRLHCGAYTQRELALREGREVVQVTAWPEKVKKAAKREECFAVCVLEVTAGEGESLMLLVRRPADGLLAGLWEFPSVVVAADGPDADAAAAMQTYVRDTLGVALPELNSRAVGSVVHIFTHIRATYRVQHARVSVEGGVYAGLLAGTPTEEDDTSPARRWVAKSEIEAQGLTTGVLKCLKLTQPKTAKKAAKGKSDKS